MIQLVMSELTDSTTQICSCVEPQGSAGNCSAMSATVRGDSLKKDIKAKTRYCRRRKKRDID